jgi:hypothetical protein
MRAGDYQNQHRIALHRIASHRTVSHRTDRIALYRKSGDVHWQLQSARSKCLTLRPFCLPNIMSLGSGSWGLYHALLTWQG